MINSWEIRNRLEQRGAMRSVRERRKASPDVVRPRGKGAEREFEVSSDIGRVHQKGAEVPTESLMVGSGKSEFDRGRLSAIRSAQVCCP